MEGSKHSGGGAGIKPETAQEIAKRAQSKSGPHGLLFYCSRMIVIVKLGLVAPNPDAAVKLAEVLLAAI